MIHLWIHSPLNIVNLQVDTKLNVLYVLQCQLLSNNCKINIITKGIDLFILS